MNDKPKEKVYAERLDSSKKNREKITKEAIQNHKKENPKTKENKKFKFTKKEDLLQHFPSNAKRKNKRVVTKILSSPFFYQK
nr:hypothetical protein [Enterococcus lactis]